MKPNEIKVGEIVLRQFNVNTHIPPIPLLVTRVAPEKIFAEAGHELDDDFSAEPGGGIDLELGWDGIRQSGRVRVGVMPCPAGEPFTLSALYRYMEGQSRYE
jgi:hypothetical protein